MTTSAPPPLSLRLRTETMDDHRAAEATALARMLVQGRADRATWVRLLRGLVEVYGALEDTLLRHRERPDVAPLVFPELFRTDAYRADLEALAGSRWPSRPGGDAAAAYAARIRQVGREDPAVVGAHAYVRYLGDLSGGAWVLEGMARALEVEPGAPGTTCLTFRGVPGGPAAAAGRFRAALDGLRSGPETADRFVEEARRSFALSRRLLESVHAPP